MERSASNRFRSRLSTIKVGSRVKINTGRHVGKIGVVESWNVEKMKWKVKLEGSSTSRHFMSSSLEAYNGAGAKKSNDDVLGVLGAADSSSGRKRVLSEKGRTAIQNVLGLDSKTKNSSTKKSRRQTMNFNKLAVARRSTKSDGTVLEVLEDNTLRANFKDGTIVIKASDRKVTTRPDGTRVVLFTPPMKDGLKKLTKFTDGCVIQNFEDGREVQIEPDGTIVQSPMADTAQPPKIPPSTVATPPKKVRPQSTSSSSAKKKSVSELLSSAQRTSSKRISKGTSVGAAFSKSFSSSSSSSTISNRNSTNNRLSTSSTSSRLSSNSSSSSSSFKKPSPASGRKSRRGVRGGLRLISQRKIKKDASWLRKKTPKHSNVDDEDDDTARVISLDPVPKLNTLGTDELMSAVAGTRMNTTDTSPAVDVAKRAAAKRRLTEEMGIKRKEEEEKRRREKRSAAAAKAKREEERKRREAAAKREEERKRRELQAQRENERKRAEAKRKTDEEKRKREESARKALEEQRERDRKAREERLRARKAEEQARVRQQARLAEEQRRKEESEKRMQREKAEKLAAEKRAKEVLRRREEAMKKAQEKEKSNAKSRTVTKKTNKKDKASQWPWSSFHFDGEVDCKEFVPDTYHRKFPARMCKACGERLGKHHIEAVKKKEHVLKAVEAGPMASRCWIHPKTNAILFVGGYKSVASKFCANEKITHVVTVAHGLKKRYAKFARAVAKAEAAKSITFLNLDWEDSQTQELGEDDLFTAFKFMHEQLESGHHVLVHCAAGQSRSGTIAAAYLTAFHKYTASKALHYVKQRRTIIDPNKGFRDKLKKLDKNGTFKKIAAKVISAMG